MARIKLAFLGPCTLRDAFEIDDPLAKEFEITRFVQSNPPLTWGWAPLREILGRPVRAEEFPAVSPFLRRCFLINAGEISLKDFFREKQFDYLVLSLADMLGSIYFVENKDKNACLAGNPCFLDTGWLAAQGLRARPVPPYSLDFEMVKKKISSYCEFIKNICEPAKIVFFEIYPCDNYDMSGCRRAFYDDETCRLRIEFIKNIYAQFAALMPGIERCQINANLTEIGNGAHKFGKHPLHFHDHVYERIVHATLRFCMDRGATNMRPSSASVINGKYDLKKICDRLYNHMLQDRREASDCYNILLACDLSLFNPMLVLVASMSKKLYRKINLYVLQSDFTEGRKNELREYCERLDIHLSIVDVDPAMFDVFRGTTRPKQVYYHFAAPVLLPSSCSKVLMLDIDILIRQDIARLYDTPLDDAWLAGCEEYPDSKIGDYCKILSHAQDRKYRRHLNYNQECLVNGGVLLLNLDRFRKCKVSLADIAALQCAADPATCLQAQPLINRLAKLDVKIFPKLYYGNMPTHMRSARKAFEMPQAHSEMYSYIKYDKGQENVIIHYAGTSDPKPWNAVMGIDNNGIRKLTPIQSDAYLQFVQEWWQMAENIPPKNYAELIATSIARNEGRKLPNLSPGHAFFLQNTRDMPLGRSQAQALAGAILARSARCNMLVFGAGSNNLIWRQINKDGTTVYLESNSQLYDNIKRAHPDVNIHFYGTGANNVSDSLAGKIDMLPLPTIIGEYEWDIIFVDAPEAFAPDKPGRALPVIWTSQVMLPKTHVFIDDYNRELEHMLTDKYIGPVAVISDPRRPGEKMDLAWRNGDWNL